VNAPSVLSVPVDLGGIWHWGYTVGLIACAVSLLLPLFRWAEALWLYYMSYCIWIMQAPRLPYGDYTRAFQATAGQSALEALLIPLAAVHYRARVQAALPYVAIVEIFGIWYQRAALMGWESFDSALLALLLPFTRWKWLFWASVITVITHHGTTALLVLLTYFAVLQRNALLVMVPTAWASMLYFRAGQAFNAGERAMAWKRMMGTWWAQGWDTVAFGFGPGSFMWNSLLIDDFRSPAFLHMHNDLLQILFELGAVGLLLTVGFVVASLRKCWDRPKIRASVIAACVFGLTYHPLRFFPSAIVVTLIFANAWSVNQSTKGEVECPSL
jgi:hypothetical protein